MVQRRVALASRSSVLLFSIAALAFGLAGCGLGGGSSVSTGVITTTSAQKTFLGGNVHGGQQPVSGATVTLWAAGVSGNTAASYGNNATSIATTTTTADGSFTFNNTTTGASPCTVGQYLYITAQGGDSGAGINSQLALMAAIPTPCNTSGSIGGVTVTPTANQLVFVDELTTAASVAALQQFMTVTPGGGTPWQIGAPSTNVVGLANAFTMVGNLVNIVTGSSSTSSTSNAVSNTLGGVTYTTVINPDYAKINTLGDILASCVNTPSSGAGNTTPSTTCASLFTDTTPVTTPATAAPTDTIQVMYYLATNAAGLTMPAHGNAAGSPSYLCGQYVTGTPPFQPTLTCSSTYDWMIGVSFKTTNGTTSATVGTPAPGSIAIDASGNIWTSTDNSSSTGGLITEFNPAGQLIYTPVTTTTISTTQGWFPPSTGSTVTLGGARPDSLAIDTNGNVWSANYYTASITDSNNTVVTGGAYEAPLAEINPTAQTSTGLLVGLSPAALAIDGNNNLFFQDNTTTGPSSSSGRFYASELEAAGTTAYTTFHTGVGRFTNVFNQIAVSEATSAWVLPFATACSNAATLFATDTSTEASQTTNGTTTTTTDGNAITLSSTSSPTTCATFGTPDTTGNIWASGGGADLEYINYSSSRTTPTVTTFASGNGSTFGGLDTPTGVTIDGVGNLWVANNVGSTSGGISEFVPNTSGTPTITAKSPAATGVYGFGSAYAYPHPIHAVIDPSGNIWVETTGGSYLYFLVGGAAPVVTPTSVQIKNSKIAIRP